MCSAPRLPFAVCLLIAALFCGGCGSANQKASFDGGVYKRGPVAFQLAPTPAQWRRVDIADASLAFRDEAHQATVLVNARCLAADERTPLVALTNHLLIGATERDYVSQGVEPFDGREALHTKLRAKWDGVPMMLDLYVLSKDGCVYDFVYMGSHEAQAEGTAQFEQFVRGFRTLPGSGVV